MNFTPFHGLSNESRASSFPPAAFEIGHHANTYTTFVDKRRPPLTTHMDMPLFSWFTGGCSSGAPISFHAHHSYVDNKQSSWNLVWCILWSYSNTKRNFRSFCPILSALCLILIEILAAWRLCEGGVRKKVFFSTYFGTSHEPMLWLGWFFFVKAECCFRLVHTKF